MHERLVGPHVCGECGRTYRLIPGDLSTDVGLVPFAHAVCECGECHVAVLRGTPRKFTEYLQEQSRGYWAARSVPTRGR